jgi:hypothetical protein
MGITISNKNIHTPQRISLSLKRFDTYQDVDGGVKYDCVDCDNVSYKLASCIIYTGTSTNGHYQTVSADGYLFDDSKVYTILIGL